MCQPGRPGPQGDSQEVSSPSLVAFQSAKSRGSSLSGSGLLLFHLIGPLARELAVVAVAPDPEVDVALRLVGVAARDQLGDQSDDLVHRLGRLGLGVGAAETEAVGVLDVPARGLLGQLGAVPGRGGVDLVVDVGDVGDERHLVAALDAASARAR